MEVLSSKLLLLSCPTCYRIAKAQIKLLACLSMVLFVRVYAQQQPRAPRQLRPCAGSSPLWVEANALSSSPCRGKVISQTCSIPCHPDRPPGSSCGHMDDFPITEGVYQYNTTYTAVCQGAAVAS